MVKLEDKRVIGGAAGVSAVLLIYATIGGKDSHADVFVTSLGALGQVWIAVMLWHLAKQQFVFTKQAADRELRSSNYDRRYALLKEWSTSSTQIGITDFNEANLATLNALPSKIEHLFGTEEKALARATCTAASEAKKRRKIILAEGTDPSKDDEYRGHIQRFRDHQSLTYNALRAHLNLTD